MAYSLNIFVCVILSFIFAMLIFVVNLTLTHSNVYRKLSKWQYLRITIQIILGIIFGFVYSLFFYVTRLSSQTDAGINVIFIIGIILPTLLYSNFWLGVGSTGMMLITNYLFYRDNAASIQLFITLSYAVYFVLIVIGTLVFKKMQPLLKNIIIQILFIILQIVYLTIFFKFANGSKIFILGNVLATEIIFNIYLLINFLSFNYINKIYSKTQKIVEDIAFDNKYFAGEVFWEGMINESIRNRNIQYGYLVGISIENAHDIAQEIGEDSLNLINDSVGKNIYDFFKDTNPVLFKHNDNFFCFFPIKDNDIRCSESNYQSKSGTANSPFVDYLNKLGAGVAALKHGKVTKPKLKIVFAVYGVHSSNFNELLGFCDDMITSIVGTSSDFAVHAFNPLRQSEDQDVINKYIQLSDVLDTTKIQIILRSYTYHEYDICTPNFSYPSKLIFHKGALIASVPEYFQDILIRHLAVKTIQQFAMRSNTSKQLLMLHYPVESVASPFYSVEKLCYKVRWMGLKTEQIILDFNLDYLNFEPTIFITNIQKLQKMGIKISVRNITSENIELVKIINPFISFYKVFDNVDLEKNREYTILMQRLLKKAKINYFN